MQKKDLKAYPHQFSGVNVKELLLQLHWRANLKF